MFRVRLPPPSGDPALDAWLLEVHEALSVLPSLSVRSLHQDPALSNTTALPGDVIVNISPSSAASRVYINASGLSTGWYPLHY